MRAARRRASAGPRAITAPIRRPGAAGLVSERTWTTWPSGSSPNSGGGAGAEAQLAERVVLDQERARPRTASSTAARRSTASVAPCGFATTGCR